MNTIESCCKSKYYSQFNLDKLLIEVQNKISSNISNISPEMIYIYHKILSRYPCYYWDNYVLNQTMLLLEKVYSSYTLSLSIDENIFNYFLMGYSSYCQLTEIVADLRNSNISSEIKTRLYRIPTYTSIVEGCLSNFFRVIVLLLGQAKNKDYSSQNTLGKLINVLNSNGFGELTTYVNVNIRNAINHGKVSIENKKTCEEIVFYYVENHKPCSIKLSVYQFDERIDKVFDVASAVLLGITTFFNQHSNLINIDTTKKECIPFSFLSMQLSIPGIYCRNISDISGDKQLNVDIEINNIDRVYIGEISIFLSVIIFEKYNNYKQYMISFSNKRMTSGWIRYTNKEIYDMSEEIRSFSDVFKDVMARGDYVIFDPSTENIGLNEIKYYCFPTYRNEKFIINHIQDASVGERKRLRANLYIGDVSTKQEIISIIKDAISWLKTVKNVPSPTMYHKSGDMEADSLYINVYRKDLRKNKELYPNNHNFVCFVDYNNNGITTLKHGGMLENIWNEFYHEKINNAIIAWREGKYFTCVKTKKAERNDPCPCGSGKKFKKCCYGKGIYD